MPTIFTHAAVPLMLGAALGRHRVSSRLLIAGAFAAMLPDGDTVAFKLGIAYADQFGHRGASHSLLFAVAIGVLGLLAYRPLRTTPWRALLWITLCTASHPLLDAFTNGGLGVALLWPWSDARIFAPWRPIAVSPIGAGFFSARGLKVVCSELLWVWLPTLLITAPWAWRRTKRAARRQRIA